MKIKPKYLLIITIFTLLLISLTTFSYATTNLQVSDIDVTVTKAKAEVTWSEDTKADGYEVYVDFPEIGYQYIGTVSNNKVQIIGFAENQMYAVKVRAYKSEGSSKVYSEFSPEVKFKLGDNTQISSDVGNVTAIRATVASNGSYGTVEWNKATNADGYEIYASIGSNSFSYLGDTEDNIVKIIGIREGVVYKIKVQPYRIVNGERIYGSFSNTVIIEYEEEAEQEVKLDKVTGLNITMDGSNANLSWNKVTNADGYEVQVRLTGSVDATYDTEKNNITLNNFTEGYTYVTKVRAYKYVNGEKVYGEYSDTKNIVYNPETNIEKVTGLKLDIDGSKVTFNWNKISNADGYEVEIYTPSGERKTYVTSYTYKTLGFTNSDKEYSVRVRAYEYVNGKKVYGDYSEREYFTTKSIEDTKVSGLNVTVDGSKVEISWDRVSGADGYEILIYTPTGAKKVDTTTSTSKTITGITDTSGEYSVKVRAYEYINGNKVYGDYSTRKYFESEVEEVDRVTGLEIKVDGSKAEISWDRVSGVDGYEMKIYTPSDGTKTYTTTSTSKTITGITDTSGRYSVKVRAYEYISGKKVYGDYSTRKYFESEAEEVDRVTGLEIKVDGSKVRFSWDKVSGADGYEMKIYTPSDGTKTYTTTSTSKTMTGFTDASGRYSVKVRAYEYISGKKVYGDYSTREYFESEVEEVDRVTGLEVNRSGQAAIFSWNRVSGADGYEIVINIPGIGNCTYTETATSRYMTGFTETKYKYTIKVRAYEYVNGKKVYGDYSKVVSF